MDAAAAHAQMGDAQATVGPFEHLVGLFPQPAVLADALVDQTRELLALALQKVVPLFEELDLLLQAQERVLGRGDFDELLGHLCFWFANVRVSSGRAIRWVTENGAWLNLRVVGNVCVRLRTPLHSVP